MASAQPLPAAAAQGTLLRCLREFHRELVALKRAAAAGSLVADAAGTAGSGAAPAEASPPTDGEAAPVDEAFGRHPSRAAAATATLVIHDRLRAIIDRQSAEAQRLGGSYGAGLHRQAAYVMAALADEAFLHAVAWAGREAWHDSLIEDAVFGTQLAGERVFDHIEILLKEGLAASPDLAAVYLVALSLGFRGKWRNEDGADDALAQYRLALHSVIARHRPPQEPDKPLFAEAYAATLDGGQPVRLSYLRPWLLAWVLAVAVGLVGQHLAWVAATADAEAVLSLGAVMQRDW